MFHLRFRNRSHAAIKQIALQIERKRNLWPLFVLCEVTQALALKRFASKLIAL